MSKLTDEEAAARHPSANYAQIYGGLCFAHGRYEGTQCPYWPKCSTDPQIHKPQSRAEPVAKFPCPCCRNLTLKERGVYSICPVCFWEDDGTEDEEKGCSPNDTPLGEARENYLAFGASNRRIAKHVRRPLPGEIPPFRAEQVAATTVVSDPRASLKGTFSPNPYPATHITSEMKYPAAVTSEDKAQPQRGLCHEEWGTKDGSQVCRCQLALGHKGNHICETWATFKVEPSEGARRTGANTPILSTAQPTTNPAMQEGGMTGGAKRKEPLMAKTDGVVVTNNDLIVAGAMRGDDEYLSIQLAGIRYYQSELAASREEAAGLVGQFAQFEQIAALLRGVHECKDDNDYQRGKVLLANAIACLLCFTTPSTALAEHDAKVRNDALEEADLHELAEFETEYRMALSVRGTPEANARRSALTLFLQNRRRRALKTPEEVKNG